MAGGIKIPFLADVSSFIKGTDNMADSLEDVADSLDDLGKSRGLDKLEDGLKDAGKQAGRLEDDISDAFKGAGKDADRLESKASDAFKGISDDARRAGDKTRKELGDGFKEASEGAETFKENAGANAKEVAASFDGSAQSIADGFQGLAAEMLEGFGPAGLAAGVAVAAGLGMASMAMQETAENATAAKQRAVDMVDAIAEAGGNLEDVDLAERIRSWGREVLEDNWITFWADESSTKFQETAKDAEAFGVKAVDAIRAASGSAEDSRKFLEATADDWKVLTERIEEGAKVNDDGSMSFNAGATAAQKQRDALSDLRGQAEENIKATENAVEIYGLETDAIGENTAATDAAKEAAEKAADAIRDKADALKESADAAMSADEAELAYIETLGQSTKDIQTNGRTMDINTEAGRANRKTLLEMAGASRTLIDAQIAQGDSAATVTKTTENARGAFIRAATAAGMTEAAAKKLADQYGLVPKNVDTQIKAHNIPETEQALNHVTRDRTVGVHLTPDGREVENYIVGLNGRTISVGVAVRGGRGIAP